MGNPWNQVKNTGYVFLKAGKKKKYSAVDKRNEVHRVTTAGDNHQVAETG